MNCLWTESKRVRLRAEGQQAAHIESGMEVLRQEVHIEAGMIPDHLHKAYCNRKAVQVHCMGDYNELDTQHLRGLDKTEPVTH